MRIKKLYIKKFKNIEEQTLMFDTSNSYCALIGLNGSGKSNWLEAVSLIFQGIYAPHKTPPFEYEIEYEHYGQAYLYRNGQAYQEDVKKKDSEIVRPRIFACYSGEELRLWQDAFESYYMSFFNRAIKNELSEPEMLFVNKYSWCLALISLMCSEDHDIRAFLKANLGIDDLSLIEVQFKINAAKLEAYKETDVKKLLNRLHVGTDGIAKVAMSELATYDIGAKTNLEFCRNVFYYIYLATMPKANRVNRVDKAIEDINVIFENGTSLRDLSEGEKKMILVHFLTRILADGNSVVLFDEPDAHVHLDRKKSIVDCFSVFPGQIIFTTHSPLFVNLMRPENIRHMIDGKVEDSNKLKQISELSGGHVNLFEGAFILSAPFTLITEGTYDIKYLKKAIDIFVQKDTKYAPLKRLAFIPMGSAGNTESFFNDVIIDLLPKARKIIYLFDYDKAGLDGWRKIETFKRTHPKLENIFYLSDYDAPCVTDVKTLPYSYYVEDMFDSSVYKDISIKLHSIGHYNEYKTYKEKHGSICNEIKTRIETRYSSFDDKDYYGFEPLLDKLLESIATC